MRVQLYNDKQVTKVVESIKRQFVINFDKAKEELEALLDAEVKRQIESNVNIQEYIEKRKSNLETVLKLVELNKQTKKISEDYYVSGSWSNTNVYDFDQKDYDEQTQNKIDTKAEKAAKIALGLNDTMYRKECLLDDLTARVAVMATVDYDEIITLLNTKINIKDYFVTL